MPVGSFAPNGFGLYDMHGNVLEWCQDWYDASYYENSPTDDPAGPEKGLAHVLRGGSWFDVPSDCRSAARACGTSAVRGKSQGFRVVCAPFPCSPRLFPSALLRLLAWVVESRAPGVRRAGFASNKLPEFPREQGGRTLTLN